MCPHFPDMTWNDIQRHSISYNYADGYGSIWLKMFLDLVTMICDRCILQGLLTSAGHVFLCYIDHSGTSVVSHNQGFV
jgi:hypothetical protein